MLWLAVEVNIFCWKMGLSAIGEAKVRVAGLQTAYMTSLNLCYIIGKQKYNNLLYHLEAQPNLT